MGRYTTQCAYYHLILFKLDTFYPIQTTIIRLNHLYTFYVRRLSDTELLIQDKICDADISEPIYSIR
jgi:hypothetical protein